MYLSQVEPNNQAKAQFLAWLQRKMPAVYHRLMTNPPPGLAGLGQETTAEPAPEKSWADKIAEWATPILQTWQQKEMMELQIKRAEQGLPPLDDDALAARVKVSTGFDKYIPWVIGGGFGVVLLVILMNQGNKRRS